MFSWDGRDGTDGQQKALVSEIHGFTASIPARTGSYFQDAGRISGHILFKWLFTKNDTTANVAAIMTVVSSNSFHKEANPKLVCIDSQPHQTVQACERVEIMNIGGFSDAVFNVTEAFQADNNQRFVAEVEAIGL